MTHVEQLGLGVLQLTIEPQSRCVLLFAQLRSLREASTAGLDLLFEHFVLLLELVVDEQQLLQFRVQQLHRRLVLVDDRHVDHLISLLRVGLLSWRSRSNLACLLFLLLLLFLGSYSGPLDRLHFGVLYGASTHYLLHR